MRARLLSLLQGVSDAFWLLPTALVIVLASLGAGVVHMQQVGALPDWLPGTWVYGGGETGARTLLGAIASSTIGVAGTIFSITIAALSLASNQMGPRLLRNFTRDRGNQLTLGILLGTFAYSLMVLRSVRGGETEAFVPALGVTVGLALAAACVGAVIYFVHHVSTRINVDTVIDLVHADLVEAIHHLPAADTPSPALPSGWDWSAAAPLRLNGDGYVQQIDTRSLTDWAGRENARLKLLVRPGDYVYPGQVSALVAPADTKTDDVLSRAVVLSRQPATSADPRYPVRQLVEVAVRALSPGVNDPLTAMNVLDRLGAALALLAERRTPDVILAHEGVPRVEVLTVDYAEFVESMLVMIRQSAGGSPAVLLHLVESLTRVAQIERASERLGELRRQGAAAYLEGRNAFDNAHDLQELELANRTFLRVLGGEP